MLVTWNLLVDKPNFIEKLYKYDENIATEKLKKINDKIQNSNKIEKPDDLRILALTKLPTFNIIENEIYTYIQKEKSKTIYIDALGEYYKTTTLTECQQYLRNMKIPNVLFTLNITEKLGKFGNNNLNEYLWTLNWMFAAYCEFYNNTITYPQYIEKIEHYNVGLVLNKPLSDSVLFKK